MCTNSEFLLTQHAHTIISHVHVTRATPQPDRMQRAGIPTPAQREMVGSSNHPAATPNPLAHEHA
eukprot:1353613-Prymnesium_polylepis.1